MQPYDPTRDALFKPESGSPIAPDATKRHLREAEYARLSYIKFEAGSAEKGRLQAAVAKWGALQGFETFSGATTGAQAFGARQDGKTYVAFRGTEPDSLGDIATDLEASLVPWFDISRSERVHEGFLEQLESIWSAIHNWLGGRPPAEVTFVGHSLGAALATLAVARLAGSAAVTLGSPRVGNEAFGRLIGAGRLTRYVDCCDLVTRLPPPVPLPNGPYAHVGTRVYIDRTGAVQSAWSDSQIDDDRDIARREYLVHMAWRTGNVLVRDLADHAPINYVRALM